MIQDNKLVMVAMFDDGSMDCGVDVVIVWYGFGMAMRDAWHSHGIVMACMVGMWKACFDPVDYKTITRINPHVTQHHQLRPVVQGSECCSEKLQKMMTK